MGFSLLTKSLLCGIIMAYMNKIYQNYQTKIMVGILVLSAVLLSVSAITTSASSSELPTISATVTSPTEIVVTAISGEFKWGDTITVETVTHPRGVLTTTEIGSTTLTRRAERATVAVNLNNLRPFTSDKIVVTLTRGSEKTTFTRSLKYAFAARTFYMWHSEYTDKYRVHVIRRGNGLFTTDDKIWVNLLITDGSKTTAHQFGMVDMKDAKTRRSFTIMKNKLPAATLKVSKIEVESTLIRGAVDLATEKHTLYEENTTTPTPTPTPTPNLNIAVTFATTLTTVTATSGTLLGDDVYKQYITYPDGDVEKTVEGPVKGADRWSSSSFEMTHQAITPPTGSKMHFTISRGGKVIATSAKIAWDTVVPIKTPVKKPIKTPVKKPTKTTLTATIGSVPTDSAQSKDIAISSVTSGAAVKYNLITNSTCNATNYGSGGTAVTLSGNAGTVTVSSESDNDKYLCAKVTKTNFTDQYFGSAKITGIDTTTPTITTTVGGTNTNRTVSATDNETGTLMKYKIIRGADTCNAANMAFGATFYTEGNTITIAAKDNGKKVCFSSRDDAGNSSYTATAALVIGSDITATIGSVPTGSAKSKDIAISSVTAGAAVKYNLITNSTCNATNYGSGGTAVTLSGNAGTVTVSSESDNDKYLCAKVTKTNFTDQYFGSAKITGIDTTAPTITTTVGGTPENRTVSATDNDGGTTTMKYKIITSSTSCNASTMASNTTTYTEGNTITIEAVNNGKKVCFSSADSAGNSSYTATAALVTGAPLTATIGSVPTGSAQSKDIAISSVTSGAAVKYNLITNSTCNATNYGSGGTAVTLSGNAGTVTVSNESDNDKYLCAKVTKTNFTDQYFGSAKITGIDTTAPTITTTVGGTPENRTVSATDNDSGTTTMKYKIITSSTSCNASTMASNTTTYTEGNTITIAAKDNGKKVCFSSTDAAGNSSYTATAALVTGAPLTATIGSVPTGSAKSKDIAISSVTSGAAVKYNLITNSTCNATNYGSGGTAVTLSGNAGTVTVSNESDNDKYLCAKVTKTNSTDQYFGSAKITGIDTTAPTITTTVGGTNTDRTVSATDNDSGTTTMEYKIIGGTDTCNATNMASGTTTYTEGNTITIAAKDNGKKVCFSSADSAGNSSYTATAALTVTVPPFTVSATHADQKLTVSVKNGEFKTSDQYKMYLILGGNSIGLGTRSVPTAGSSFTDSTASVLIKAGWRMYVEIIRDGKVLATTPTITSTVTAPTPTPLTATIGSVPTGSAQSKDIAISSVTSGAAVKYNLITNSACNATNYGSGGTAVTLSGNAGTVTVSNESDNDKYLCAKVTKTNSTDQYFGSAKITGIDTTAPTITTTVGGTNTDRTVSATDNDSGTTTMEYKLIGGTDTCNATNMASGTTTYTEGNTITIAAKDNGKKVCFSSTDSAGNSSYTATAALTVTTPTPTPTPLTATIGSVPTGSAQSKDIAISSVTSGAAVKYNLITNSACNATNYGSGGTAVTLSGNAGTVTVSNESDNDKYLCAKVTKTNSTDQYFGSAKITGIDTTAPTITTTVGGTNTDRTVSATDNDSGTTTMEYKIIGGTDTCNATNMASGTTTYTEGNTITIAAKDNGKKVCFSSTDSAGNSSYTATAALTVTAPTPTPLTATIGSVPTGSAQSKDIAISSVTSGAAVKYNLITNSACNATNYGSGGTAVTLSGNAGTVTVSNESDNDKYLCAKVTKTNSTDQYFGSAKITGIDTTAPTITTTVGGTNTDRTVSATDNDSGTTTMEYKLIGGTDTCNATNMASGTTTYTEGNTITIAAKDNGKKVCFSSADSAGNSSYTATAALTVTVPPVSAPAPGEMVTISTQVSERTITVSATSGQFYKSSDQYMIYVMAADGSTQTISPASIEDGTSFEATVPSEMNISEGSIVMVGILRYGNGIALSSGKTIQ